MNSSNDAKKDFSSFTNKYQLSKTLRFELIPQGKTREHIETKGLLQRDEHRAESYKKVKKIIDEYHKVFIEKAMKDFRLEGLENFKLLYLKKEKEDKDKKELQEVMKGLRKQIAACFSNNKDESVAAIYKNLFAKELIKKDLKDFVKEEDKELIEEFEDFTTYFTGFHENRKNIYTHEEKSTAIAYRLIHENLPSFLDNLGVYQSIKEDHPDLDFSPMEKELYEVLNGMRVKGIEEVFTLDFFNNMLTQKGIDAYNAILGGKSEKGQRKIKGVNEYIHEHRQLKGLTLRQLPNLKPLYKQILSDRESISFLPEYFEKDQELLDSIKAFYQNGLCSWEKDGKTQDVLQEIENLLLPLNEFDLEKIFIKNDISLTGISQKIFGDWSFIGDALGSYYEHKNPLPKKLTKTYEEKKEKWVTETTHFSIADIQRALDLYKTKNEEAKEKITASILCSFFGSMGEVQVAGEPKAPNLLQRIEESYGPVTDLLNTPYPENRKLAQDKAEVSKIKNFLDTVMDLLHFIKPLHPRENIQEKDVKFYNAYSTLFDQLNLITDLYNKTRNYLTKKPYSTEKIKLNFENSTLLDGWDANKETDNTSVLLRKNGFFYLAIMDKKHNRIFNQIPKLNNGEASYEKMNYKLLPLINQQLPRVFFAKSRIEYFNPSQEILKNYENDTHKKGETFNINDCHALIDFFKASLERHEDWKNFNFKFSPTTSYEDLSGFYREVEQQGYKVTFQNVPENYINRMVEEGKLYLFQIYNKDFSPFSKGKPNLHTLYWKMLFAEENLKNVVYKLNGQAEVFFRKKSLNYDEKILKTGHHAEKLKDRFNYPIISNRRFAFDKFQFHVPITLNFKATGNGNINQDVLTYLKNNPNVNIIGIDRGERHLLYVTLIDQQRNIKQQFSLNEIVNRYNGKEYATNYHAKLDAKEKDRDVARKSWGVIENIRELKEGYLSQVVHQIAGMMVEHNAVVVMEDLNFGFKRGRQKVEKQVYQKFEKMLIDKLNCLVFKNKETSETGGVLNALQLSNKFESFQKLGKQSGFIFYVEASHTSKIDPATGFVNFLHPKYENIVKAQEFFGSFESIRFNGEKDWFEFEFDYNKFTAKAEGSRTRWTVCTTPEVRYVWNRNKENTQGKGGYDEYRITEKMKSLFDGEDIRIRYQNGSDIKQAIVGQPSVPFFKELTRLLNVTLALRHNNGKKGDEEKDFILSPVANNKGEFFNSLKADASQPQNADANGAYHIALKGLWVLHQINEANDLKKVKLAISNKEWLQFVQRYES